MPVATMVAPGDVRDLAQAVEDMGFDYIVAWDHVLGADVSYHTPWAGPDTLVPIHEPFVLFGFLAACTRRVGLTAVIGLPQRQTALVAKQAAEVDVLTEGRLRLGVALGWVAPEFEALNEDFSTRGRRVEEQIDLLRALWTQAVVDFDGDRHRVDHLGISPLPVQQPIPIWIGGHAQASLRRVAPSKAANRPPARRYRIRSPRPLRPAGLNCHASAATPRRVLSEPSPGRPISAAIVRIW